MAPSRSKKSKYKKTSRAKAVSPHKDEESMSKTKQRVSCFPNIQVDDLNFRIIGFVILVLLSPGLDCEFLHS